MFVLLYWLLIKEPLIEKYFREVYGTIGFIRFEFGIKNMEFCFPFPVSYHPKYEIWEEKKSSFLCYTWSIFSSVFDSIIISFLFYAVVPSYFLYEVNNKNSPVAKPLCSSY